MSDADLRTKEREALTGDELARLRAAAQRCRAGACCAGHDAGAVERLEDALFASFTRSTATPNDPDTSVYLPDITSCVFYYSRESRQFMIEAKQKNLQLFIHNNSWLAC